MMEFLNDMRRNFSNDLTNNRLGTIAITIGIPSAVIYFSTWNKYALAALGVASLLGASGYALKKSHS